MSIVKRLRLLTGVLGAAAATAVVGSSVFGDLRGPGSAGRPVPAEPVRLDGDRLAEDLARTKFSDKPALTYTSPNGDRLFAWQVRPTLAARAAAPRDIVVMVDTSASQAGTSLDRARKVLGSLIKSVTADDRVDVWTVNIDNPAATRSLTDGPKPGTDAALHTAIAKLADSEYGAGAVDLPAALKQVTAQFPNKAGRTQAILFLGDGESAASTTPLTEASRTELGTRLADREIAFFAVPIGSKINAYNLHGLATLTGGDVVRINDNLDAAQGRAAAADRLTQAIDAPILRPTTVTFGGGVAEVFPSRLPPMRADRPTLVLGKLTTDAPSVTATVVGRVGDQKVSVDLAERLPESQADNFFLYPMHEQWKSATDKDAPALLSADRSLAMASEQFRLFRDEFVAQGVWAIKADKLDHAEKLFQAAATVDPESKVATACVKVVHRMRTGDVGRDRVQTALAGGRKVERLQEIAQEPPPGVGVTPAPQAGDGDAAIERARAAQAIVDQQFRVLVDETLREGRRLRDADPDAAYESIKRQRDAVLSNDQITPVTRRRLVADLEAAMLDIQTRGAEIKRQLAAQRERIAAARQRLTEFDRRMSLEEQTKARIRAFAELMQEARFELAYAEAEVMIEERVARGLTVPPETIAAYRIGQAATNLREANALRRIRQDRYLLTMMQVEKSFIPYPDEPPVHFPPAAVWRELTARRQAAYTSSSLGPDTPETMRRLERALEQERVYLTLPLNQYTLTTILDTFREKYQIPFFVRTDLFKAADPTEGEQIGDKQFKIDSPLNGVTLGSYLDVVLLNIGASYIVRPEYIEIVPTKTRIDEKQFRAFEVADLVIPIPNSVNQSALQQNLALFGSQLAIAGNSIGAAQQFGNVVNFGGNGGGAQFPQGNPIGGGQNPFQAGGGGGGGGGFGQVNQALNLGVGGGVAGVTGGQLGQFGNLGGQFGLQGGNQASILIDLIRLVVAYKEWDSSTVGVVLPDDSDEEDDLSGPVIATDQLNSLGYYPPALALVVRGTARYHPNSSFKLPQNAPGGFGGFGIRNDPNRRNRNVAGEPRNGLDGKVAAAGPGNGDGIVNPKDSARAVLARSGKDAGKVWNEAFNRTITDPNLVLTAAEAMAEMGEYAHAAEALKAGLRKGRAGGNWAFDALTIALQQSQAAPAEVERVALSGLDLDPTDPKAFLKAAKAENELGRVDAAIAFCQRAAEIEPNLPTTYANALVYAERSSDVKTDVVHWATANLLNRDWTADGVDYHQMARDRATTIAAKYEASGHKADAGRLSGLLAEETSRDLVVEARWVGSADVDLAVTEPVGSVCTATHPRTTGGGVLKCDVLEQRDANRSETYVASQGYSGTYRIAVYASLGQPVGNKVQLVVTKYAGTDRQEVQLFTMDLTEDEAVEVTLDGGSRTDLASLPPVDNKARRETTDSGATFGPTGMSAGATAGSASLMTMPTGVNTARAMPLVTATAENSIRAMSPGLPQLRVEGKVSADRSKMEMTVSPIFSQQASDIPLPRVQLLPGGEPL